MTVTDIRNYHTAGVLTHRQAHVLELRHRGFSQNQIATGLHISRSTVRYLEREARRKIARHQLAQLEIAVTIDGTPVIITTGHEPDLPYVDPKEPAA